MKRVITSWIILASVATLFMAQQGAAAAAAEGAVAISVDMHLTGQTSAEGTFTSSGAISDSGTATETFQIAQDGKSVEGDKTLAGSRGNVSIHFSGAIAPVQGSSNLQITGTWQTVSGTQAYSGISGGGQVNTTLDLGAGTLHADYTGNVSLASGTPGMPRTGGASDLPIVLLATATAAAMLSGGIFLTMPGRSLKRRRHS